MPSLHLAGLLVLSLGAGLYAAGMSSVKAIKLSMKLEPTAHRAAAHPGPPVEPG